MTEPTKRVRPDRGPGARAKPQPPPAPGTVRITKGDLAGHLDAIMQFLQSYYDLKGYTPTLREICEHINRSKMSTLRYLDALEEQGKIRRDPRRPIVIVTD